jgi:hypothetical protein
MSYPPARFPVHRPEGYSLHYDYGGFRRKRRITFTAEGRDFLLRMYRNALRRCGRADGWTEEIEAAVAAGSYTASFDIVGDDCKHFAEELDEMGCRKTAINVDAFAWAEEVADAEARHEREINRMTSVCVTNITHKRISSC